MTESTDKIKESLNTVFKSVESFITGEKKITSLKDVVDFIKLIVDMLNEVIKSFISLVPYVNQIVEYLIDFVTKLLSSFNASPETIEIVVLLTPIIPFLYLLVYVIQMI